MSDATGQFWIEGKNLGETIDTIQRWARHAFPDQTPDRIMAHLSEEQWELEEAYEEQDIEWISREIADNIILLTILCDVLGIDLLVALHDKHKKNLDRKPKFHPELGYDKMDG